MTVADNDQIRDAILAREKEENGIILSNVAGWHSGGGIIDRGVPAIDALGEAFKEAGADMTSNTVPPNIRGNSKSSSTARGNGFPSRAI